MLKQILRGVAFKKVFATTKDVVKWIYYYRAQIFEIHTKPKGRKKRKKAVEGVYAVTMSHCQHLLLQLCANKILDWKYETIVVKKQERISILMFIRLKKKIIGGDNQVSQFLDEMMWNKKNMWNGIRFGNSNSKRQKTSTQQLVE